MLLVRGLQGAVFESAPFVAVGATVRRLAPGPLPETARGCPEPHVDIYGKCSACGGQCVRGGEKYNP